MPIKVNALQVGSLKTNCYLITKGGSEKCLIVDPGDDAEYIQSRIATLELTPEAIIATHGHYDHLMAIQELKLFFDIPFFLPQKDHTMLNWYRKSAIRFEGFDPGPPPIPDGDVTNNLSGDYGLGVIETPGHTPGGICLYGKGEGLLFSGDTIFAGGEIGSYNYRYSDKEKFLESIEKLLKLPKDTVVYPGHGKETTIGEFKIGYNARYGSSYS